MKTSQGETPEGQHEGLQNDLNLLDSKQLEIYKGLRSIGQEISAFYRDGVRILHSNNLETRSYLLAHIAREIECGLRDILSHDEKTEKDQEPTTPKHLGIHCHCTRNEF